VIRPSLITLRICLRCGPTVLRLATYLEILVSSSRVITSTAEPHYVAANSHRAYKEGPHFENKLSNTVIDKKYNTITNENDNEVIS